MEEQEKNIQDYLAIVSRRKAAIISTALFVFLIGMITALIWPPTFRSSATILIKEQEIPTELVRSTVTSYAAQRIQTISQRVMTRPNLMAIVEKYKLYVKERKRNTMEEVLEEMRGDIDLQMISAEVMDPRTGRPGVAAIAFTLSYDGGSAESTQKVAGELTSLFLAENLRTRKDKASETYLFLTEETSRLEAKIEESAKKLAEFKEKNIHSLPEMSVMNLTLLTRTESELESVDAELRALKERQFYYQSQLAQINPLMNMRSATGQAILDPASRLKSLESEYASLAAKYSDQHPDIVKVKREIAGLKKSTGLDSDSSELVKTLTSKRTEYAVVEKKYSASHPDAVRLKSEIASLEDAIALNPIKTEKQAMKIQPENPAYITVQAQLKTVETELKSNATRKQKLIEKLAKVEIVISKSPQVEKEYLFLSRQQESAYTRFQDIKVRQMEAEIGQQLEKESKGESFVLIDPAQYPEKPVKPNRIIIVVLSFILAIVAGLGVAILKEALDGSVRGVLGVNKLLTSAPLAVIPLIYNTTDLKRKKRVNQMVIVSIIGSIILVLLMLHFFWTPLDVLWFKGIRKAEDVIGI